MQLSNSEILTLIITVVGLIVWLVRLEGRVNLNERLLNDLIQNVGKVQRDVHHIRRSIDIAVRRRRDDTDDPEDDETTGDRRD